MILTDVLLKWYIREVYDLSVTVVYNLPYVSENISGQIMACDFDIIGNNIINSLHKFDLHRWNIFSWLYAYVDAVLAYLHNAANTHSWRPALSFSVSRCNRSFIKTQIEGWCHIQDTG